MPGTLEEDQPRDTRTDTYTHAEAGTTVSIASGRQVHHDCRALLSSWYLACPVIQTRG